ncbi:hypothetical protein OJAV_G00217300 [Oryzias javanicus]|uniref:Ig-like domain-containing protein n=1 Tax=Oryzias javanicus TaxID=123683 RepID=A0A3S2MEV4_ORYJA|nr:hypothetical protein OJAV_G00217300 [Oryzias javanicus]
MLVVSGAFEPRWLPLCLSTAEAQFGEGTKLTVLETEICFREKQTERLRLRLRLQLFLQPFFSVNTYEPAFFGSGTKLTVLGAYEAYFGSGTRLTVLEKDPRPPAKVRVFEPSKKECSKDQKTLVCVASGFYPDHVSVSWKIDDENVTEGVATDSEAKRSGEFYRISSRLTVAPETWFSSRTFTCTVSFFNGSTTTDHSESIRGEDKEIPSGTELSRDKYLWISQSAKLSYIIFIAKSCVYGAFIWFVAWKLQSSAAAKNEK